MYTFITTMFLVLFFGGIVLGFASMVYFAFIRRRYEQLISLYQQQGFFMPSYHGFMAHLGYFGSFYPVRFFYLLLTGKKIKTGRNSYLSNEPYVFLSSRPVAEIGWIKGYYYFSLVWLVSVTIGAVFGCIDMLLSHTPP
ncbi:hypothetical protein [Serratia rhizosphaerae]|uniref:Uncharacterized protein n=1 Tax=Serratia rhizosphaerae TaxID=2597702 RepID=A0ABX6GN48_9GAMM|nr:hypothetical protein [Serratia rhizosphaerae]MEB6334175.1 hypothetical protein [Serratia rhizosphaerae]QHA87705.1 hypothetical protein FO014_12490 [Serratia rhizosphaerae]